MKAKPAKPGEIYGVPGQGDSLKISALLSLPWLDLCMVAGHLRSAYIKPLFLPSPMGVIDAFLTMLRDGFTGASFWEHTWVSTLRVFGAFLLACVVGIPLGIAMGMSPVMHAVFLIHPLSFTDPFHHWLTCHS
jgi:taurine transport system permease protein